LTVNRISVIGGGLMGRGIAYAALVGGFETRLFDVSDEALRTARERIHEDLDAGVERKKLTAEEAETARERLTTVSDLAAVTEGSDFVIEAVPENIELKTSTFARLDELCPEQVVLATNTSALAISEIAAVTSNPARVIGMHFFNPVPKMKLVEIVRTADTGDAAIEATRAVAERMRKQTVLVKESPGFITSRVNATIGNEAFLILEQGIATAEDIDTALKLGLNHPMGPFELVDLVGLDTRLAVLRFLHEKLGEKYKPADLLVKYVEEGRLGKKVGRGVYDYGEGA